ncbi:MAG: hypothetical protein M1828_002788 [Chrysothrix sp. TS-e1954]|nr:MAG: hypothetical protein M1828_002788 [Chrysothrix sp. TS-e1954]
MPVLVQGIGNRSSANSVQQVLKESTSKHSTSTSTLPTGTEVKSITFAPLREPHRQTIVLLHGRGDTADQFSAFLLLTSIPQYQSLQTAFPHARFVFLSAPSRPVAQLLNLESKHQWYDIWSLKEPEEKEELMKEGLRESVNWVHDVLSNESEKVGGLQNVVLAGLSQGCATSLAAMLLLEGERGPAACVGMCGWLPYQMRVQRALDSTKEALQNSDITTSTQDSSDDYTQEDRLRAIQTIRDRLDLPPSSAYAYTLAYQHTPFLLCHGLKDHKVLPELGTSATETLRKLGANVGWKDYPDLGHWYSSDMLKDVVEFMGSCLRVELGGGKGHGAEMERKMSPSEVAAEESGDIL